MGGKDGGKDKRLTGLRAVWVDSERREARVERVAVEGREGWVMEK